MTEPKTVYLAKYEDGRPSISKAILVKETDLSIRFSEINHVMGHIWISNRVATRKNYLRSENVMVSESLVDCLKHILACADDEMKDLEIKFAQAKKHVKVFGEAIKAKDKKEIADILGGLRK